ncbi:hypothetical protein ACFYO1_27020 [Nocardia sp. NPDC006044]|uniref:globin domain-containing protein n=1 Tax=Nocardia sp. NPDC006044 TaxID=3364306 RepID=UPI0036871CC1
MPSMYEHVGGAEVLHRVEAAFYDRALADPVLKTLFTERRPDHVDHLTWFTAESFGGPEQFSRELGFDHLIAVHRGLAITDEQYRTGRGRATEVRTPASAVAVANAPGSLRLSARTSAW